MQCNLLLATPRWTGFLYRPGRDAGDGPALHPGQEGGGAAAAVRRGAAAGHLLDPPGRHRQAEAQQRRLHHPRDHAAGAQVGGVG